MEPVKLREGEGLTIFIRKRKASEAPNKYLDLFGKASVEELKEYEEEAQTQ